MMAEKLKTVDSDGFVGTIKNRLELLFTSSDMNVLGSACSGTGSFLDCIVLIQS